MLKLIALTGVAASVAVGAAAAPSRATTTTNDLTTAGSSRTISGVLFTTADFQPAGTGYIQSFVRIQSNGTEQGYNTSARPVAFDELTDPNFTRDVQLSQVGTVTIGGQTYVQFSLDINESASVGDRFLSLDSVRIYVSDTGLHSGTNLGSLGTPVFTFNGNQNNFIKLDYRLNSGSGQGDMNMFVPLSMFTAAGATLNSYVTLYSHFGTHDSSNAGFEEWTSRGTPIPTPGAAVLLTAGAGILGLRRRRR